MTRLIDHRGVGVALAVAFWAAALFALVMALLPHPPTLSGDLSDKVQHIIAFAVLTGLALAAYPAAHPLRIGLWLALLGALIEIAQLFPALHRDGSALDWLADCGAILVVLALGTPLRRALAGWLSRSRRSRAQASSSMSQ